MVATCPTCKTKTDAWSNPTCPKCGNGNAMLLRSRPMGTDIYECRDCGHQTTTILPLSWGCGKCKKSFKAYAEG